MLIKLTQTNIYFSQWINKYAWYTLLRGSHTVRNFFVQNCTTSYMLRCSKHSAFLKNFCWRTSANPSAVYDERIIRKDVMDDGDSCWRNTERRSDVLCVDVEVTEADVFLERSFSITNSSFKDYRGCFSIPKRRRVDLNSHKSTLISPTRINLTCASLLIFTCSANSSFRSI